MIVLRTWSESPTPSSAPSTVTEVRALTNKTAPVFPANASLFPVVGVAVTVNS